MQELFTTAKEYYDLGICTFPVGLDKLPYKRASWKSRQTELLPPMETDAPAFAIVCGKGSGNVEVIDVDIKYDITEKLWDGYKRQIDFMDPELLKKLVVQKTAGGGYHMIYRCKKIEGNKKLASRHATEEEKAKGEKAKVLLETRGQGGYILAAPSPGYEIIYGKMGNIPILTQVERQTLLIAARYFDEVEVKDRTPMVGTEGEGVSPFQDYNERGDALSLLVSHGWQKMYDNKENTMLRRPGKTKGGGSGTFHKMNNWLYIFSTSTEFDVEQHYKPAAIFCQLECAGDWTEAARRLKQMGYGEQDKKQGEIPAEKEDFSFLESTDKMNTWLHSVMTNGIKKGLPTCFPSLNEHYLYKPNSFEVINGHDNVGKTVVLIFLAVDSARSHGWKWIIWPAENNPAMIKKKVIEFYMKKGLKDLTKNEYRKALQFAEEHFLFLNNDKIYTHDEILTVGQRSFRKGRYKGFLIDPYNALSLEMSKYKGQSTHEYHYAVTSKMRLFAAEYCSLYLNCHAVSEALRRLGKDNLPMPPHKADTEGGGKFSNRADNFLTIHRKTQHETEWMVTDIHVRKIKEQETGGRPTPIDEPIRIRMVKGGCDFIEYVKADFGESDRQVSYNPDQYIEPTRIEDIPF